jgi:Protein of unknown function (DUF2958)
MKTLITDEQREQLLVNGRARAQGQSLDPHPVVKLFTPDAHATWLLTELDPTDDDTAFGLCDLGLGMPKLDHFRFSELASIRGPLNQPIERDYAGGGRSFKKTMHHLENASRKIGDARLHMAIRKSETLPNAQQVNCGQQLDVLLSEIVRISQ